MTRSDAKMIAEEFYKILAKQNQLPNNDRYLDVAEVAAMMHLSKQTIYNMGAKLPCTKVGGKLLFSEKQIREYIERR